MRTGGLLIAAAYVVAVLPATAAELPRRVKVYDGDTITASIRVENVDTPEIRGQCPRERTLARQARDFTAAWIAARAGELVIRASKVDRYGRLVARVSAGGEDLGEALIAAGLARPWRGRRESWC